MPDSEIIFGEPQTGTSRTVPLAVSRLEPGRCLTEYAVRPNGSTVVTGIWLRAPRQQHRARRALTTVTRLAARWLLLTAAMIGALVVFGLAGADAGSLAGEITSQQAAQAVDAAWFYVTTIGAFALIVVLAAAWAGEDFVQLTRALAKRAGHVLRAAVATVQRTLRAGRRS